MTLPSSRFMSLLLVCRVLKDSGFGALPTMKAPCFTFTCVVAIGAAVATWHFGERRGVLEERNSDYKERLAPRGKTRFSRLADRELKSAVEDYLKRLHAFSKLRDLALNNQKQLEKVLRLYDSNSTLSTWARVEHCPKRCWTESKIPESLETFHQEDLFLWQEVWLEQIPLIP